MKIKLSKKRLYSPLIIGLIWIILGVISFLSKDVYINWMAYVYLLLGAGHLFDFFYSSKNLYLLIENNSIKEVKLFRSNTKMDLDQIQEIQKVEGDYIVKSETKTIKIDFNSIDNSSLLNLMEVFKEIDLPPEKNYFSRFKTHT